MSAPAEPTPTGAPTGAPTGTPAPPAGRSAAAWQAALAAEEQAVFGYALLGAHLRDSPHLAQAVTCSNAHESLRNDTASAIAATGLTPVAPAADYPDLYPVDSARQAITLAARLEGDCAAAWRYLYAVAATRSTRHDGRLRTGAQAALTASAVRATRWRKILDPASATVAFPGLP